LNVKPLSSNHFQPIISSWVDSTYPGFRTLACNWTDDWTTWRTTGRTKTWANGLQLGRCEMWTEDQQRGQI